MKWSDIFFADGVFEGVMLIFLYLAGLFFLGVAIYVAVLMVKG